MRETKPPRPTEGDAQLQAFVASLRKHDLAVATIRSYQHDVDVFLRWLGDVGGDPKRLDLLTEIDLINYRQHLVSVRRLRPATINRRLHALKRLCRWATEGERILETNIARDVKTLRSAPRRRPLGLRAREVHSLLRAAGQSKHHLAKRNYAILQLMLQTGLRVQEVASLCVADVTIRNRTGSVRVRHGKGRQEREIPLNTTARRALRQYLDSCETREPENSFFLSKRGTPLSVRSLQSFVTELARRAKITRLQVSPHTLRHTFALNYLKQNPGKLVELASLLGHESLNTTAIYTQPSTKELADDLERSSLNV